MNIYDAYAILWADLKVLRRRIIRYSIGALMSPFLYLVAFGWGLGRGITMEGMSYFSFVVPGIIALTSMNASYNGAGTRLNVDKLFFKSFDELLMSPISHSSLVVGKASIGVFRGMVSSLLFVLLALAVAPDFCPDAIFFVCLLASCFMFSFLGVLCALHVKTHQDMNTFSSVILLPMTFLGGTFFSLQNVPEGLRYVLNVLPLTHSSACLRAASVGGQFPWYSLAVMGFFLAAFAVMCMYKVQRISV